MTEARARARITKLADTVGELFEELDGDEQLGYLAPFVEDAWAKLEVARRALLGEYVVPGGPVYEEPS